MPHQSLHHLTFSESVMGNLFSACSAPATARSDSPTHDARTAVESENASLRNSRSIAAGNSPRTSVMARVRENWIAANEVTMNEMARRGVCGARRIAVQKALSNVSNFYHKQLFRKLNMHCIGEDRHEDVSYHGQTSLLSRKVSFLSIAPQLEDIDSLTGASPEYPAPRIDVHTRRVLEEVLKTILLNHRIIEADAVTGAQRGERGLPLTLDSKSFEEFLFSNEALLTGVIEACRQDTGRFASLAPLLQALATDYFITAGRLPDRLEVAPQQFFHGLPVPDEPVTVLVGDFDECGGRHLVDTSTEEEKILLTLGAPVVTGPLSSCRSMLKGFEAHGAAEQRAAAVLQTLFYDITSAEESIIRYGFQCFTENECLQSAGTSRHVSYTGSVHIGDACGLSDDGHGHRMHSCAPLRRLPQLMQEHEAAYQVPLLADPELKEWIEDPCFEHDVHGITYPALRLPLAQVKTTGKLLLQTKAFGGTGTTS